MPAAAELRFVQFGALALRVHIPDSDEVIAVLKQRQRQAPALLEQAPLALDLAPLAGEDIDLGAIRRLLSALQDEDIAVLGLIDGSDQKSLAGQLALPLLGSASERRSAPPSPERQSTSEWAPTRLIDGQVRSGQQIYARQADLVVYGSISAGAEVIADGSIHIYGALRGRALAGASGLSDARIFIQEFHAELISVAGHYKVLEELPENLRGQAIQARLENDQLSMVALR